MKASSAPGAENLHAGIGLSYPKTAGFSGIIQTFATLEGIQVLWLNVLLMRRRVNSFRILVVTRYACRNQLAVR